MTRSSIPKTKLNNVVIARACINKDFVHSGSIGLIQGKHLRYCHNILDLRISLQWFKVNLSPLSEVNLECIYNGSFVLALAKSIYYPFVNA